MDMILMWFGIMTNITSLLYGIYLILYQGVFVNITNLFCNYLLETEIELQMLMVVIIGVILKLLINSVLGILISLGGHRLGNYLCDAGLKIQKKKKGK